MFKFLWPRKIHVKVMTDFLVWLRERDFLVWLRERDLVQILR